MSSMTPNTSVQSASGPQPTAAQGSQGMTYDQVENIWIQAGGNPQAAAMAAAVADASSGLNPGASYTNPDGSNSVGLWLIPTNGSPPGSNDPIANARAAIQQSNNGTDWSQWCTAWSDNNCGQDGGTYLGDGSNALGSLGQRLTPASYNVIGAAPTGTGTSASTASSTPTSSGGSNIMLYIALGVLVLAGLYWWVKRRTGGSLGDSSPSGESDTRSQASWTPAEESMLSGGQSDSDISKSTGRSIRAIRVRRN